MKWFAVLLVLLMCGAASAATSDFGYYKIITINQTMVNQSIGTGQYPLLVSVTDANLGARCQADGDDIVFYDADNTTQLDHEIESWNKTTGVLVAWVNVTDITNVSTVGMYYYDADGTNLEDAAEVWDSNYVMVQHLQEIDIDGGSGDIKDSTLNNNGTTYNMDSADQVSGQIDGSFDFDGTNDLINCTAIDYSTFNNNISISAWVNGTAFDGSDFIVATNDFWFSTYDSEFLWRVANTGHNSLVSINTNELYYLAGTYNHINIVLYVNGSEVYNIGEMDTLYGSGDTLIGSEWNTDHLWTGVIDEVRISNIVRSGEYIQTNYNNSQYPSLFISFGSEQSNGGDITAPSVTSLSDSPDTQGFGENVTINCNVTDAVGVNIVLIGITPPSDGETNYTMTDAAPVFSYNYLDYTNGSYSYRIYANDSADNWNSTETGTFELYSETYIHIKTLKDTYGASEYVNITDPASISSTSGSITDGQNITVSGSDFGTGPTVHKWDDFDNGIDGNVISNGWEVPQSPTYEPVYDDQNNRSGSSLSVHAPVGTEDLVYAHGATLSPVFVTFWIYRDTSGVTNNKWFRIWNDYHAITPKLTAIEQWGTGANMVNIASATEYVMTSQQITPFSQTTWERMEVYVVESASPGGTFDGTADGTVFVWQQTGGVGNTFSKTLNKDGNQLTNSNGYSTHFEEVVFFDNCEGTSCETWADDIYIANSLARIEIGNNSSWASCTHREIQIPTAWSGTSSNIIINQGAFGDTDTAYLFVVNSTGVASNGYEITFGSGSAPVRSAGAPTGAQTTGTISLNISLTTDINSTCKFENNTGGVAYDSMTYTFGATGLLSHSTLVSGLSDGNEYTYCVKCNSTAGNANTDDYNITFSISNASNTMTTWDTTDGELKNASETIYFYVNYTNATGPINSSGDYVNISFADTNAGPFAGNISMVYNAATEWYEYNRSWATVGQYFYEVKAYEGSVLDQEEINYIDVDYQSRIYNKQTTNNITAHVLMQVEFYNTTTSSWVLDDVCYNSSHQITTETNLKLDDLFNGTWHTTDNASFGGGTYRVYVAYTDPSGNVLENLDGTYMNDSYNFTLDTGVNTITLYANEYAVLNNWTADQTFSQIAANISNDVAYSYYNSTSGLWEAYRAGYTYNANAIVPKNCSAFVFVNSQTTASATPNTGGVTITQDAWFYGYLPGSTAKTLTEIETAMDTDGLDVWSLYGWDNATQAYTATGSYSVSPNEGYAAYVNTTGEYTP
jgi:hypothetical protein